MNIYQLYTTEQTGAHTTDPTRIQQGPITRVLRKTLRMFQAAPRYQIEGPVCCMFLKLIPMYYEKKNTKTIAAYVIICAN